MKKIMIVMTAILMTASVANACAGITITGKSGATYCLSKFQMNWYSAYAWCKEQNMNLIEMGTTCGTNIGLCSELILSSAEQSKITEAGGNVGSVWTNTSDTSSNAVYVHLISGGYHTNLSRKINLYALCF